MNEIRFAEEETPPMEVDRVEIMSNGWVKAIDDGLRYQFPAWRVSRVTGEVVYYE